MAPRRRERVSPSSQGLAPGERLDRDALAGNASSTWGWVGTEASNTSEITTNHLLAACGLLDPSRPFCRNKFKETSRASSTDPLAIKDTDDDVIVISDDETPTCSKKSCKSNPFCLNYLGQDKWENDEHQETFKELAKVGSNPSEETRIDDLPVGLRNLGATCYANASLQVWFRDLAFRAGVFNCRPLEGLEDKFQESPIFQLQVTFAALQESKQMVFNPTKLVESLQLRTGEQQDAQEFSKLFMSHLDAEFKKQPTPSLRTLVHDQFEGKLVYGTICACQYRSERSSDFLEIEVNFKNNQKLEDCLEFFLETEKLSGDNQYFCPQCDSLQDATRYTELRELPPVLHFSLLRFVYDLSTMERKKSKNTILFPKRLRMGHFLGNSTQRQQARTASTDEDTYELSGILLHKGTSAYHGHYEAQAFDPRSGSWYQFNDEVVTQIKSLGDKKPKKVEVDIESDDEGESKKQATGTKRKKKLASNSRKRQRVDDSEVESPEPTPTLAPSAESSHISSKDAYMLIYTRVKTEGNLTGPSRKSKSIESTPEPPSQALQVIGRLNETHVAACEDYARRVKMLEDTFAELKLKVQEVYCNWNLSSITEDWVVTSRKTLEGWLSKYSMQSVLSQQRVPDAAEAHDPASSAAKQTIMSVEDILCEHARLDYRKVAQMKVIHRTAYDKIVEDTQCSFDHLLTIDEICCRTCVEAAFRERLYHIQHPLHVKQFNQLQGNEPNCNGYWISRQWLKDWCLQKPKMHKPSEDDPPPDAPEYDRHVRCQHGALSLNGLLRRQISVEASLIFTNLFPDWTPLSTDEETCSICDAVHYESKNNNSRHRKQAEDEKAKLKTMYDYVFEGSMLFLENGPYAIIPNEFLRRWKQWLDKPTEAMRPESIDNEQFFCEHQKLCIDPNNPSDFSTAAIIKRQEWDVLCTLYSGGPLIALDRYLGADTDEPKFFYEPPICEGCRTKRKLNWDATAITVCLLNGNASAVPKNGHSATHLRNNGTRQSRRLRQVRENGEKRRLNVTRSTTVKEIKVMIQEEFNIPTICQGLYYDNVELDDNSATMGSLSILANSLLTLREIREVEEISDSEDNTVRKREREEGQGFGGTLLSSQNLSTGSVAQEKSCDKCTFSNPLDRLACDMCDTIFV